MTPSLPRLHTRAVLSTFLAAGVLVLCVLAAGCAKENVHTSDPQLKGIDAMLSSQLPPGTPAARVMTFIHMRGYEQRDAVEAHTVVAIVNHINPETLRPEAARVTFHFDPVSDKLTHFDLDPAPVETIH